MTDLDLERLGDVWRQQPDPKELEELRRSAEAVRRRAIWGRRLDWIAAAVAAVAVIVLVASSGRLVTMLIGVGAILFLLSAQRRQRRLREEELRALTGPPDKMLEQAIERLQTKLRHSRISVLATGPALLIGYFVAATSKPSIGLFEDAPISRLALLAGVAAIFVISIIIAMRRHRRELERMLAMRESYREET